MCPNMEIGARGGTDRPQQAMIPYLFSPVSVC